MLQQSSLSQAPSPVAEQTFVSSAQASSVMSQASPLLDEHLPHAYACVEDDPLPAVPVPAKLLLRPSTLEDTCFILPGYQVFVDKILPPIDVNLQQCIEFPLAYFVSLHSIVSTATSVYPAYTPNYCGARIPLRHTGLNIARWRHHLIGYEDSSITQFLEFGFPLGLTDDPPPTLVSTLRNHGSSYQYYTYLDEFLSTYLERCEVAGPCYSPVWCTTWVPLDMCPILPRCISIGTFILLKKSFILPYYISIGTFILLKKLDNVE